MACKRTLRSMSSGVVSLKNFCSSIISALTSAFGPLPVFLGKGVERQKLDPEFAAAFDALAHRARALFVTEDARQAAPLGPATVAVEDDGDVPGNGRWRGFHGQTWMVWLRRGPDADNPELCVGQFADALQIAAGRYRGRSS